MIESQTFNDCAIFPAIFAKKYKPSENERVYIIC